MKKHTTIAASLMITLAACGDDGPHFEATVIYTVKEEARVDAFRSDFVPGLTSVGESYAKSTLDYELESAGGATVRFGSCPEIEAAEERMIEPSQSPLLRMQKVNCTAVKWYHESTHPQHTFVPNALTEEWVSTLPSDAVATITAEDIDRRKGKLLTETDTIQSMRVSEDGSIEVETPTDVLHYHLMAVSDFNGDGFADQLLRVDWRSKESSGTGTDLLVVSQFAEDGKLHVVRRLELEGKR